MFNHNEFTRDAMAVLAWKHGTVHISLLVTTMFFKVMGNCRGSAFDVWQGSFLYVYTPVEWPICILSQTVEYDVERFFYFCWILKGSKLVQFEIRSLQGEKTKKQGGGAQRRFCWGHQEEIQTDFRFQCLFLYPTQKGCTACIGTVRNYPTLWWKSLWTPRSKTNKQ